MKGIKALVLKGGPFLLGLLVVVGIGIVDVQAGLELPGSGSGQRGVIPQSYWGNSVAVGAAKQKNENETMNFDPRRFDPCHAAREYVVESAIKFPFRVLGALLDGRRQKQLKEIEEAAKESKPSSPPLKPPYSGRAPEDTPPYF